jgi:hypothetical protein
MSLKLRRGTTAERLATVFEQGELIYTTDSKQLYAGDGTTLGGTLVSYEGSVQGALGGNLILNGNDITGQGNINITQGTIFAQGNITTAGNLVAQGNVIAQGNVVLGDGENGDTINFEGSVNSNILPAATDTYALGSESQRWDTLHINNVFGDLEGNVRANDSTILVDAQAGVLRGVHIGSLQGNVAGNVSGNVTGDVTGSIRASDGTVILTNGTDGTDAVFTGQLNGTVLNGVLTTESYDDPTWITTLNGNKIFGPIGGGINPVFFDGDLKGSVFGEDSTMLVDSNISVLRGTHIGDLQGTVYTGALSIINNTISSDTNQDLILTSQGSGNVNVPGTIEVGRLAVGNDPATGGISITQSTNAAQPLLVYGAYDSANSSVGTGASLIFGRARGIPTAPTLLTANDEISTIVFSGFHGSGFGDAVNIAAKAVSVSGTTVEGRLEFRTTNSSGVSATKLAVNGDGSMEMTDSLLDEGIATGEVNTSVAPSKFIKVFIGATAYAMPLYAINA